MKKNLGFTLIELLIVVAIIGILAAIAIPNFLNAQVRAKVAKAKAEQSTLGTALEAYSVDYNNYPPNWAAGGMWPYYIPDELTTPVAYMSNGALIDAFPKKGQPEGHISTRYRYKNLNAGVFNWIAGDGSKADQQLLGKWMIASHGPYRLLCLPNGFSDGNTAGDWVWLPYDPTNGTTSRGNIIRSQSRPESNLVHPSRNYTYTEY